MPMLRGPGAGITPPRGRRSARLTARRGVGTFPARMPSPLPPSRHAAAARYAARRREVYERVAAELAPDLLAPCRLGPIDADALAAWTHTWAPARPRPEPVGDWDWPALAARYRRVDALTLAIWSGEALCGLLAGQPSKAHHRLRLEYLEGSPDAAHPLRGHVLDVAMLAAVRYAQVLGATALRLVDPAPGLVAVYQARYGFGPARAEGGGTYCDLAL